ncbi:MarR family transcriptional regulator [Thermosipho ferrireducens]|uniref:HTH-type transcriptional regulator SarZ n=1 Tax=Thermosipho ferrireducens TaxID=2571116 RepID=A0ABX7S6S6_9BACT|nr:MarR family transcriptional regulator [Thermosipho ferrireducens]QTA37475.1 MarR family transcriptional regulator [Thermosipho ferrireducens]
MYKKKELITDKRCQLNQEKVIDDNCCIDEIGELVQKLVRVFQLFERDQIKVFGFTTSQCYCLLELLKSDPSGLTMNALSEKMKLDTSTMTRIVDKLVRDKFLLRERSEKDRRIVIVKLTEKGKSSAIQLRDSINQFYKKIIKNLPEGRVTEVLSSVSLLLNAFEKANPNCC